MVFRLLPVHVCEVAQVEAYFSYMAERGLFVKYVFGFVCFQRGREEKTKYHLEPIGDVNKKPLSELCLLFENAGWKYICKLSNTFYIFKSVGEETREVPSNPLLQESEIKEIKNICIRKFLGALFVSLLSLAGIIYLSFFQDYFIYNFVTFGLSIMLIAFIYLGYEAIREFQSIKTVKLYLQTGYIFHQEAPFAPKYWKIRLHYFMVLVMAVGISIFYYQQFAEWEKNLVGYQGKSPAISLSTIETNPNLQIEELSDKISFNNNIHFKSSGLTSEIYEIWEEGFIVNENGEETTTYIDTEVYHLRFQFLISPFFEDLVAYKINLRKLDSNNCTYLQDTPFDQALLITTDDGQAIFASTGKKVVYVYYYGSKDLSKFTDEIYQALNTLN